MKNVSMGVQKTTGREACLSNFLPGLTSFETESSTCTLLNSFFSACTLSELWTTFLHFHLLI